MTDGLALSRRSSLVHIIDQAPPIMLRHTGVESACGMPWPEVTQLDQHPSIALEHTWNLLRILYGVYFKVSIAKPADLVASAWLGRSNESQSWVTRLASVSHLHAS